MQNKFNQTIDRLRLDAADTAKRFQKDERGAIAMIFGFTAVVMLVTCGLAIDGGRAYHAQSRTDSAVDGAALAAARGMRLYNLSDAETKALAKTYFDNNMKHNGDSAKVLSFEAVLDRPTSTVVVNARMEVPNYFGVLINVPNFTFNTTATARFESVDLEISMQLDNTGSMAEPSGSGGSKIASLIDASKDFVDILIPDAPTGSKTRIALAPFDVGVNAGTLLDKVDGNRPSVDGCTYERKLTASQATDALPNNTDYLKISADLPASSDKVCPTAQVLPLTDDKVKLKNEIDTFTAGSWTAGHLGTAWAYYLLSPNWATILPGASAPVLFTDKTTRKVAVLMTDGVYNTVGGDHTQPVQSGKFAVDTCNAMKANGIVVYTVLFKPDPADEAAAVAVMNACASAPGKDGKSRALVADSGDQLRSAFRSIAEDVASLRLTN
jgi:Flp pilus assembly protein TadG